MHVVSACVGEALCECEDCLSLSVCFPEHLGLIGSLTASVDRCIVLWLCFPEQASLNGSVTACVRVMCVLCFFMGFPERASHSGS